MNGKLCSFVTQLTNI